MAGDWPCNSYHHGPWCDARCRATWTSLYSGTTTANPVATTPHSPTEVEDAPRDAQPARLSGEVL